MHARNAAGINVARRNADKITHVADFVSSTPREKRYTPPQHPLDQQLYCSSDSRVAFQLNNHHVDTRCVNVGNRPICAFSTRDGILGVPRPGEFELILIITTMLKSCLRQRRNSIRISSHQQIYAAMR